MAAGASSRSVVRDVLAAADLLDAGDLGGETATDGASPTGGAGISAAAAWAAVLVIAADEVAATTRAAQHWSDEDRTRVVAQLDRAARTIDAAKAPVLVAHESSGAWRRPGVRSFEAYRAAQGREDLTAARREASTARTLTELEGGLDAMSRGDLTPSHVHQLGRVAEKVDHSARKLLLTGEGAAMVRDLAKRHDPRKFARKVEELAATRRPADVQDAHEVARSRRFLRLMPGPDGTRVEGFLDPLAGHGLQLALEAASPRPGADDPRTLGQRNADALETIATTVLREGELAPSRNVPTQVVVTMSESSLLAAEAHLARASHRPALREETATEAGCECSDVPFPLIRAQDGPLLPPAEVGRLLCDSAVGRLVVSAEGVPLNAGRAQRAFKGPLRRAVELRDAHCTWPSCTVRARYCEVHHLDHWDSDYGETDVHRGVLLCTFHHHELHTHDLDLVAVPSSEPRAVPAPLPGDPEYEPPRYQTVPRARTADDRRARMVTRLRRDSATRRRRMTA